MRQRGRGEEEDATAAGPAGHYQAGGVGTRRGGSRAAPPTSSRPSAAWFPTAGSSSLPSAPWLHTWPACWPAGRNRTARKEVTGVRGGRERGRGRSWPPPRGGELPHRTLTPGDAVGGWPCRPTKPLLAGEWGPREPGGVPRGVRGVSGGWRPPRPSEQGEVGAMGQGGATTQPCFAWGFFAAPKMFCTGGGKSGFSLLLFLIAWQPGTFHPRGDTFHPPLPSIPQPGG